MRCILLKIVNNIQVIKLEDEVINTNMIMSIIQKTDNSILVYIKTNMHGYFMDKFMIVITNLGNGAIIWIIIALLLICKKKYRNIGIIALGALILSAILGDGILKNLVQRIRPSAYLQQIDLLIPRPLSYSFPSGHTTSSFAVAGVLARYFKDYTLEFFTLASLIAFSRLYLYVHYPTDVLGGIILGLICSKVAINIYNKLIEKYTFRNRSSS